MLSFGPLTNAMSGAVDPQKIEAELDHGQHAVAVEMEVHPVDRTLREAEAVRRRPPADEVGKPEAPVAFVLRRQADQLGAVARPLQVRIHRDLEIRLLEALHLLGDHRHAGGLPAKVLAEPLQ
jgi:hypothetical protein